MVKGRQSIAYARSFEMIRTDRILIQKQQPTSMRFHLPELSAIPISLDQLLKGIGQPRVFLTKAFGFRQRLIEQLFGRFEVAFF